VTGDDLLALSAAHVQSIGDVEQSLPGEDGLIDELLSRRESRAAPATAKVVETESAASEERAGQAPDARTTTMPPHRQPQHASAIEQFITSWLTKELKMADAMDPSRSVFDYGVDSVTGVMLVAALEEWLGVDLSPELVYEVPVIRQLAARLGQHAEDAATER
jgi:acyl carrier protein